MAISTFSLVFSLSVAAVIIFNIAGNFLVCAVILKKKAMKTSVNWLLFHLAIADLLVAVFFIPPIILSHFIEQPSGVTGDLLCKFVFVGALGWVAALMSTFLLVMIAFERYNATLHPLEQLSRSRSRWSVPIMWVLALLLVSPLFVVSTYDAENQMCVDNFPNHVTSRAFYLFWAFCNELVPITIMGYLYTRIILRLRAVVLVPVSYPNSVSQSRHKVTKMLISVSVIFIACWTPAAVLCLLTPVIPGRRATVNSVAKASALLNSSLNPVVYSFYSQHFRKNVASMVPCCKSK
ncbi:neuropeptide FF receptor 2-like [Orbicella faveolata]|uniref:neuropeptide FF receptor 2-like n=1 Tax=Orbicella faveolata TaxID=48498 RepID=UPI0009E50747|nr:neuropeptide FF receptor 2-like [Orbicella faveolata]